MKAAPQARLVPLVLVLLALGLLTSSTGVYFMLLRPPLLPEDSRFIGLGTEEVPEALARWLSIVFRTWGGFMVGFGLSLLGLAGYFQTRRDAWLRGGYWPQAGPKALNSAALTSAPGIADARDPSEIRQAKEKRNRQTAYRDERTHD